MSSRRSPVHAFLLRRNPGLVRPHLSNDSGADGGARHASFNFRNDFAGQVVDGPMIDEVAGRIIGFAIPTATHHQMNARTLGHAKELLRAAADASDGAVDNALPTQSPKCEYLFANDVVVFQLAGVVIAARNLPDLVVQVFMGQGYAQFPRLYGTLN